MAGSQFTGFARHFETDPSFAVHEHFHTFSVEKPGGSGKEFFQEKSTVIGLSFRANEWTGGKRVRRCRLGLWDRKDGLIG
jgi:hypothetical protein